MAAKKTTKAPGRKKKTKKKAVRRGRPPGSRNAKKRGRPPGRKKAKKRGRPAVRRMTAKSSAGAITLPASTTNDLTFWSNMVVFLNNHKGKTFVVQMDGINYSLVAQ